ncbi:hypothetical protein niasHS_002431 [Heterodera schachtii]|uniref:ELYS beta-propeller domain-containing protein n=1 Tax=Heterodera schachtii TaxID=97005 RepID=A0ABD2KJX9_HETSC
MSLLNVPEILKQKLIEVEGTLKTISPQSSHGESLPAPAQYVEPLSFKKGRFLLWKGVETGFLYLTGHPNPGSLTVYDYKNGTANAVLCFSHQFGPTALIVDAIYFPLSTDHPGILVAVTDRSMDQHGDYLAYFSLLSHTLLNAFYVPQPITSICSILDGSAQRDQFLRLSNSFHKDWPHILLVGCRYGDVILVYLDLQTQKLSTEAVQKSNSPSTALSTKTEEIRPIRCKKNVHLTKIFYEDKMFVFRADDGTTKCLAKEKVMVSALHWEEKCGLVLVGFNFGGVMAVSLRTSKVYSLLYIDGSVLNFAFQEPEEDPRPILFLWIAFSSPRSGTSLLLCNVNFPKDEERNKLSLQVEEYTYLEPQFAPYMKWPLVNCVRLHTMRTIQLQKCLFNGNSDSDPSSADGSLTVKDLTHHVRSDTSLLFVTWAEMAHHEEMRVNGALFDLNAFYAKRMIPKIHPDSTIARQIPFISRFFSQGPLFSNQTFLDIIPNAVYRFSPLAFLNESIDQLYYPSTYHLKNSTLTSGSIFQAEVRPIQVQLINELSQNFVSYFENPTRCVGWIHAIGLANSAPSTNINEERVCLLRVVMHSFFPGVISLIENSTGEIELLKFIQKWIWKELEITKAKFDELCSPLFANPPHDLSPNSQGYVQHARLFFKRASIVFRLIHSAVDKLNDPDWLHSIIVQETTVRQVRLYSTCIAFGLLYKLLPIDPLNSRLYATVTEKFSRRVEKLNKIGRKPQIHKLIGQIIELNSQNEIWQGKTAEWYPPKDFTSLLPILLFVNISETAKTELIGYYCLDLESAAATFGSTTEVKDCSTPPSYSTRLRQFNQPSYSFRSRKFFTLFLSVLSEENLSTEEMDRLKTLWLEDKLMAETKSGAENLLVLSSNGISAQTSSSRTDIKQLREELLKNDWGLYKFNEAMLERGHFHLLLEMPPLKGDEPKSVQKCYSRCLDIKRRFPTLFRKRKALPPPVIFHFREKAIHQSDNWHLLPSVQSESVHQCQLVLPINKYAVTSFSSNTQKINHQRNSRVSKMEHFEGISHCKTSTEPKEDEENADDFEIFEELPLTIATPKRKERNVFCEKHFPTNANAVFVVADNEPLETHPKTPTAAPGGMTPQPNGRVSPVACNIIQKGSVKAKDWDRIVKITQTPLSLRKSMGDSSKCPLRQQRSFERARTILFPSETTPQTTGKKIVTRSVTKKLDRKKEDEGQTTPTRKKTDEDRPNEKCTPPTTNVDRPIALPFSILKSDRKRSRLPTDSLSCKPRLRFAQALFTTEQIPSRAEKAMDQDTSFSNFASLSGSEPSLNSSPKSVGLSNSPYSGACEDREVRPKKAKLPVILFPNGNPPPSC